MINPEERIAHGYFFAKNYIIKKGFASEIDWQEELNFDNLTEQRFLEQFAWVVIASGMNDKVVRKIFPKIRSILFEFKSGKKNLAHKAECYQKSLAVFNHPGKISAILSAVDFTNKYSFEFTKENIRNHGIAFIQSFPFMGQATSLHLAKNLGLDVVKPDRHLVRISTLLGYDNPKTFCSQLSSQISEKVSIIDIVLWRYATLDRNYMKTISWYIGKS